MGIYNFVDHTGLPEGRWVRSGLCQLPEQNSPPFFAWFVELEVDLETGRGRNCWNWSVATISGQSIRRFARARWRRRPAGSGHGVNGGDLLQRRGLPPTTVSPTTRCWGIRYAQDDQHSGGERRSYGPFGAKSVGEAGVVTPVGATANAQFSRRQESSLHGVPLRRKNSPRNQGRGQTYV